MKYRVTFTAIGDFALQLLQTRGSLIIFDKDVPYSYENMVLSHTKGELKGDVAVGDTLLIADREYKVVQVGEDANENLRAHGHVTLRFVEADAGEDVQPGEIVLVGAGIPRVMVGDVLEIV
jgi:protein-N(Pi)-phosphohistidine--sugar phosphotransferase